MAAPQSPQVKLPERRWQLSKRLVGPNICRFVPGFVRWRVSSLALNRT